MQLSSQQIEQIVEELSVGMICYVHKETGDIKAIFDSDGMYGDMEIWEEEIEEIERNRASYVSISKMSSRESYEVMEDFIATLSDVGMKKKLLLAIDGRKPFRKFKDQVDYHEDIRQRWFAFKNSAYKRYVSQNLSHAFEFSKTDSEDADVFPKDKINLNGRVFRVTYNSAEGEADADTLFEYTQVGTLITGQYHGGTIKHGQIIGELKNNEIQMLYQCMTTDNELKAGKATAEVELESNGKVRMMVDWEWLDGTDEQGTSEYMEE